MPSGDAQRVWFPEMLDDLASTWSPDMGWDVLSDFCRRMTEKRHELRRARGILPPRTRCPSCGEVHRSDIKGVSVRSALFALKKLGTITDLEFKALDRSFKRHRRTTGADAYGNRPTPEGDKPTPEAEP